MADDYSYISCVALWRCREGDDFWVKECIIAFFAIMFVIVTYLYVKLRSQIKDITEQIEFIEKNQSNALVTSQIEIGGLKGLKDVLNKLFEKHRAERIVWKKRENEIADIYTNFCVIKGTVSQKPYYLSFIQTDAYCTMLLHTIYEPYIQYPQYYDTYANPLYENESYSDECQYSKEESKAMVLDTLRTMGISDYTITDVQKAQTIKPDYEITKDGEIIASDSSNDGYSYDSYLLYGGRNVDGIAPVHTDFNFSRELVSGTIGENSSSNDSYTNTRYGFEAIFANVGNDGINYLVIQNPMKVEEVLETNAQLLSFDQIDAIAKDYISKFDGTTLPFSADNTYKIKEIQYGLIRLFDEESDSYMYIPAWYYMIDGESLSSPFCTFSPYVIISAIDGSIYHDYNGNIN